MNTEVAGQDSGQDLQVCRRGGRQKMLGEAPKARDSRIGATWPAKDFCDADYST